MIIGANALHVVKGTNTYRGLFSDTNDVSGIANISATGLTVSGSIELGNASDTTLSRSSAGTMAVEGVPVATSTNAIELTNKTITAAVGKGTWTASGTWTLPAVTLGGAITYGGVTLSNAVTGTGNMVLSAAPTLTGTTTVATLAATTIGAYTLSGTIAGGGNQINNVIIGTSTPLAGSFTTLAASGTISSTKTATVGAAVDTSGITSQTGITDGSSSSVIITGACAIVTITENTAFDTAVYLVGAGTAQTLLGQTGTKFVSPTTGPLAGHVSFSYDGSTGNRVYNKLGSTADFKVAVWKLN
jgi:autotransporter-associated beta strand protein